LDYGLILPRGNKPVKEAADVARKNTEEIIPEPVEIPQEDEVYRIWVRLHRVVELIVRSREKELARYGVPIRQVATLFAIHAFEDKATLTQLADFLGRRPHTISSILTRMEKDGLIRKRADEARHNVVRVSLTEKGLQAYANTTRRESINRIMTALAGNEQAQLGHFLERMEKEAQAELSRRIREVPVKRVE
jgi:DNA-binding MarR family transcriptional regulator